MLSYVYFIFRYRLGNKYRGVPVIADPVYTYVKIIIKVWLQVLYIKCSTRHTGEMLIKHKMKPSALLALRLPVCQVLYFMYSTHSHALTVHEELCMGGIKEKKQCYILVI